MDAPTADFTYAGSLAEKAEGRLSCAADIARRLQRGGDLHREVSVVK
jgi:hypothetical protein